MSVDAEQTGVEERARWPILPALEEVGGGRFRTEQHLFYEGLLSREGVFRVDGGELMAHTISAAERVHPGRRVVALNTVFVREGRHEHPTEYELTELQSGRNFGNLAVLASQPGRGPVAHSQVLLTAALAGLDHQGVDRPAVDFADGATYAAPYLIEPATVAGGRGLGDPIQGEPQIDLKLPIPAALPDAGAVRQYLAMAFDHLTTAPPLRPHAGVGFWTKKEFYTAPIGVQLRYFDDCHPGGALTVSMISPVMRGGFATVQAHAFDDEGRVVVSCGMDMLVRVADRPAPA